MALPTLDATFALSADLPRRQMLAKWLVEETGETGGNSSVLVSGLDEYSPYNPNGQYLYSGTLNSKPRYDKSEDEYVVWSGSAWNITSNDGDVLFSSDEDVSNPWLVTTWTAENGGGSPVVTESPAPSPLSNYYSLPERYLWAKIAVAAGGPNSEAAYISLPKNYAWSDIYNAVSGDIAFSATTVSGAGSSEVNGTYTYRGENNGKPYYNLVGEPDNVDQSVVVWIGDRWQILDAAQSESYESLEDTGFPWLVETWMVAGVGQNPAPTLTFQTPNHTDWSENVALGHIAAAYRGDTGNPANLATYIDWPWRYKVASIIQAL
jgi:hypothetical protein